MLQQQQCVLDAGGLAHLQQRALQLERRAVGDAAEIKDVVTIDELPALATAIH